MAQLQRWSERRCRPQHGAAAFRAWWSGLLACPIATLLGRLRILPTPPRRLPCSSAAVACAAVRCRLCARGYSGFCGLFVKSWFCYRFAVAARPATWAAAGGAWQGWWRIAVARTRASAGWPTVPTRSRTAPRWRARIRRSGRCGTGLPGQAVCQAGRPLPGAARGCFRGRHRCGLRPGRADPQRLALLASGDAAGSGADRADPAQRLRGAGAGVAALEARAGAPHRPRHAACGRGVGRHRARHRPGRGGHRRHRARLGAGAG